MSEMIKLSTFPKVISCIVMFYSGFMTWKIYEWIKTVDEITAGHGVVVGAFVGPLLLLLKFAFDFAGDGKIDSN